MISVSTLLAIPLVLATATAPSHRSSTKDAAGAPAADARVIQLEVDATKLETFEAPTRTRLEHELPAVVTKAGLRTANGDDASEANVRIVITFGKSKIDYEYVITAARRNGDRITEFAGACMRCVREDAVKLIVTDTQTVLERVRDQLRKPAAVGPAEGAEPVGPAVGPVGEGPGEPPTPVGQGTEPVPASHAEHPQHERSTRLNGFEKGAIVAGVVGLGVTGAGIGLMIRGVRGEPDPVDFEYEVGRDARNTGIVLTVVGAASIVASVALGAYGAKRRSRSTTALPIGGRGFVGFGFVGRF